MDFGGAGTETGPERHHVPGNEWAPMCDAALAATCAIPDDVAGQNKLLKALRAAFRDPKGLLLLCENCHDDAHGKARRF